MPNQIPLPDQSSDPLQKPLLPSGWVRALIYLVAFIGYSVVVGIVVALAFGFVSTEFFIAGMTKPIMIPIHYTILLGVLLLTFTFRRLLDRQSFVSLGFYVDKHLLKELLYGFLWGAAIVISVLAVLLPLGQVSISAVTLDLGTLLISFLVLIAVAAQEEIVTRGYLLCNLMDSVNRYLALLIVSVLFSIGHVFNPDYNTIAFLNIILAGLLLGIYYVHRRRLWFPIGLHLGWNFFLGPVIGSPVSGAKMRGILTLDLRGSEILTGGTFGFEASVVTTAVTIAAICLVHFVYRDTGPHQSMLG